MISLNIISTLTPSPRGHSDELDTEVVLLVISSFMFGDVLQCYSYELVMTPVFI